MAISKSDGHEAVERIAAEIRDRRRRGETVDVEEYARRYPELADAIRDVADAVPEQSGEAETRDDGVSDVVLPPGAHIPAGTRIGNYRVVSELGRGGMGVVYCAEDLQRGGTVALKTLLWGDPTAMLRFKQEFRAIADISHPNLASLYELVSEDGRLFFTMELVDGVDFLEWVEAEPSRRRAALAQLAQGLHALHSAGRIHRDLKPSNVLVARDGRVVLLDFGLAAIVDRQGAHQSTVRHAIGTPGYMAPEQAMGRPVTPACDWYAMGVILYESIAGRLPFAGTPMEMLVAKQQDAPPPLSDVARDVPTDLEALCTDLLRREPDDRPTGTEVLRRLNPGGPTPAPSDESRDDLAEPAIVGRDAHLQVLRKAFTALRDRRPVVVSIHGNSGMGKTTIVQHFLEEVHRDSDAVVLQGKCYERESVPYKALDSPIDALARHLGRLPRAEAEALLPRDVHSIARVFPVLRRVEAIAQAPPPLVAIPDPQELRLRAFAGLREVFARLSDRRPLVLCVDDLQWGDADSADLLTSILRAPEAPAFLFVGCHRREDADASPFLRSFRQHGQGLPPTREIPVDPLSEEESQALAASLLGSGTAAARAAVVAHESRGSPFFLHELAACGDAVSDAGVTLEEMLRRRTQTLSSAAGALLEVVAVAGGPVSLAAAAFAAQLEVGAQSSTMAALRGSRLVRVATTDAGESLDTYHDRVREIVVAGLEEQRRRELHRRLGHALSADPDIDPEVLAVHFEGARDLAQAGAHYVRAAEEARRALAFDHAARLYEKALDLLAPTGPERRGLLRHLADALADAGRGTDAGPVYVEAAVGAERVENLELRSLAAQQFLATGRLAEWRTIIGPLQHELGIRVTTSPLLARVRVVRDFVWFRLRGFRYRRRDPATIPKEALLRLEMCHSLASTFSQTNVMQGMQYHTLSVRLALALGHPQHVAMVASRHFIFEASSAAPGDRRYERLRETAEHLADDCGTPFARAYVELCGGIGLSMMTRWRDACEPLRSAARRLREECVGYQWERNVAGLWLLMCLDYLGEYRELVSAGESRLRDALDRDDLFMETDLRTRITYLADLARDDPDAALAGLDRAIEKWPTQAGSIQHIRWTESRVNVALYRGEYEAARDLLDRQWPDLKRSLTKAFWRMLVAPRERLSLLEAATDPTSERARALLAKTAHVGSRLAAARGSYGAGLGRLLQAGAANLSGDVDAALQHLESAEAQFVDADTAAYVAVVRRRRAALIGGDEGRDPLTRADEWFTREGIRNADAWSRMLAPGLEAPHRG